VLELANFALGALLPSGAVLATHAVITSLIGFVEYVVGGATRLGAALLFGTPLLGVVELVLEAPNLGVLGIVQVRAATGLSPPNNSPHFRADLLGITHIWLAFSYVPDSDATNYRNFVAP
jgi:hypothetical protein